MGEFRHSFSFKYTAILLIFTFFFSSITPVPQVFAQSVLNLPAPGTMVAPSAHYFPAVIKGIKIFEDNPLRFDFIIDSGEKNFEDEAFKQEASKLIKYFLASLTTPEDQLWVNLSPYEKDRIVPAQFGMTEMGRDLLAQDYILKQLTASLVYPEKVLGQKFWDTVYKKAQKEFGTTDIPINTFNKVWVVPDKAVVYENGDTAFIVKTHLRVMLEGDYLALKNNLNNPQLATGLLKEDEAQVVSATASDVIREVLLPEIEKEVNEGEHFAPLRQIYNSLVLATWFKQNLKESILGKMYMNENKIAGVEVDDRQIKEKIYQQYLEAFKKGVYNYIKEEYDATTQEVIPRKYFSGGFNFNDKAMLAALQIEQKDKATIAQEVQMGSRGRLKTASAILNPMRSGLESVRKLDGGRLGAVQQTISNFQDIQNSFEDLREILDELSEIEKITAPLMGDTEEWKESAVRPKAAPPKEQLEKMSLDQLRNEFIKIQEKEKRLRRSAETLVNQTLKEEDISQYYETRKYVKGKFKIEQLKSRLLIRKSIHLPVFLSNIRQGKAYHHVMQEIQEIYAAKLLKQEGFASKAQYMDRLRELRTRLELNEDGSEKDLEYPPWFSEASEKEYLALVKEYKRLYLLQRVNFPLFSNSWMGNFNRYADYTIKMENREYEEFKSEGYSVLLNDLVSYHYTFKKNVMDYVLKVLNQILSVDGQTPLLIENLPSIKLDDRNSLTQLLNVVSPKASSQVAKLFILLQAETLLQPYQDEHDVEHFLQAYLDEISEMFKKFDLQSLNRPEISGKSDPEVLRQIKEIFAYIQLRIILNRPNRISGSDLLKQTGDFRTPEFIAANILLYLENFQTEENVYSQQWIRESLIEFIQGVNEEDLRSVENSDIPGLKEAVKYIREGKLIPKYEDLMKMKIDEKFESPYGQEWFVKLALHFFRQKDSVFQTLGLNVLGLLPYGSIKVGTNITQEEGNRLLKRAKNIYLDSKHRSQMMSILGQLGQEGLRVLIESRVVGSEPTINYLINEIPFENLKPLLGLLKEHMVQWDDEISIGVLRGIQKKQADALDEDTKAFLRLAALIHQEKSIKLSGIIRWRIKKDAQINRPEIDLLLRQFENKKVFIARCLETFEREYSFNDKLYAFLFEKIVSERVDPEQVTSDFILKVAIEFVSQKFSLNSIDAEDLGSFLKLYDFLQSEPHKNLTAIQQKIQSSSNQRETLNLFLRQFENREKISEVFNATFKQDFSLKDEMLKFLFHKVIAEGIEPEQIPSNFIRKVSAEFVARTFILDSIDEKDLEGFLKLYDFLNSEPRRLLFVVQNRLKSSNSQSATLNLVLKQFENKNLIEVALPGPSEFKKEIYQVLFINALEKGLEVEQITPQLIREAGVNYLLQKIPKLEQGVVVGNRVMHADELFDYITKNRKFSMPGYYRDFMNMMNSNRNESESFDRDFDYDQTQEGQWTEEQMSQIGLDEMIQQGSGRFAYHQITQSNDDTLILEEAILTAGYLLPTAVLEGLNMDNTFMQSVKAGKINPLTKTGYLHFTIDSTVVYKESPFGFAYPVEFLMENFCYMGSPVRLSDNFPIRGFSRNVDDPSHRVPVSAGILLAPRARQAELETLLKRLQTQYGQTWQPPAAIFYYDGKKVEDGRVQLEEHVKSLKGEKSQKIVLSKKPQVVGEFENPWSPIKILLYSVKSAPITNGVIKYKELPFLTRYNTKVHPEEPEIKIHGVKDLSEELEVIASKTIAGVGLSLNASSSGIVDTGSSKRGTYQEDPKGEGLPKDFDLMAYMDGDQMPSEEKLREFQDAFNKELVQSGFLERALGPKIASQELKLGTSIDYRQTAGHALVTVKILKANDPNVPYFSIDVVFYADEKNNDGPRYQNQFLKNMDSIVSNIGHDEQEEAKQYILSTIRTLKMLFINEGAYKRMEGGLRGVGTEQLVMQMNGAIDHLGTPKPVQSLEELQRVFSVDSVMKKLLKLGFDEKGEYKPLEEGKKDFTLWDIGAYETSPVNLAGNLSQSSYNLMLGLAMDYEDVSKTMGEDGKDKAVVATLLMQKQSQEYTPIDSVNDRDKGTQESVRTEAEQREQAVAGKTAPVENRVEDLKVPAKAEKDAAIAPPVQNVTADPVGGIDLNPEFLRMEKTGSGIDIKLNVDPGVLQNIPFDGLNPVIFRIVPTNLPMFLGLTDNIEEEQLSQLR